MKNIFEFHYFNLITRKIKNRYWNIINYFSAFLWKVKLGKKCNFFGRTYLNRIPESVIEIGNSCTFISSKNINLIGVYSPCIISTLKKNAIIYIGNNCGFSGTVIASRLKIKIGNNVRCGANTMITDTDWHTDDYRSGKDKEIIIEDNVWLGYGVKVLKGVHIGKNSLIGAGSIVTRDIPENVIAAGNPCKIIKTL